ncbi:MAG: DUF1707 domain-containing protein [Gemmatimonadota bacterium]|nr:DUF1707 domain-containing protein [Gemmatimonadota bacterium]
MTDARPPAETISADERQRSVDRLCVHFAEDNLDEEELERRLDLAYAARTKEELAALERDLPVLADSGTPAARETAVIGPRVDAAQTAARSDFMIAVMGGTERKGHWVPPRRLTCLSLMGGAGIDFRDATFATEEISVKLVTVMGGVEILVPPGVRVEWNGVAIMGGFGSEDRLPTDPDAPLIRITGLVLMGGVSVQERLPGESAREAKKRLKAWRKAQRELPSPSDD